MAHFILEGEWTGYTSAQRKIVHREIFSDGTANGRAFLEKLKALRCIVYTDGTSLLLSLREAKRGEKIIENKTYYTLIRDALHHAPGKGRVLVADLPN